MLKLLLGNPWVIVGLVAAFGGLFGWAIWERHDAIAAAKGEKAALMQADLSAQDAKRWEAASDLRDQAIVTLTGKLNDQSAAVEQGRARETELRTSLDQARATNDALQQQADQLSKELDDAAVSAPGDVVPIGPIVAKRVQQLFN